MRDTGNRGASRNQSTTERPGRLETERSPLDQAWKAACAARAATGEPPWRAEPAPQLTGPSVRKLKVSYVRAGAGRGALGPGAPSRCTPPARPLSRRCSWPGRSTRGPTGRGCGGGWGAGLQHSLETRPPAPNPGPPTQTSPGPAGTASAKSPSPDASSRTPFPSPLPLPALRTSRRPGPSGPPVRNLEPGTPRAPDPDP